MLEAEFRAALIDFLLPQLEGGDLIACELPFAGARRRADVVIIGSHTMHALEIKTARDNVATLSDQVVDYARTFPLFTAVLDSCHASAVKMLPRSAGVVLYVNDAFLWKRRPIERSRLSKTFLADLIPRKLVLSTIRERPAKIGPREDTYALRHRLTCALPAEDIKELAIRALRQKYGVQFNTFLSERGACTHPEDVQLLRFLESEIS